MNDKARQAWQTLDLDGVAEGEEAERESWQHIALSLCDRSDALSCLVAIQGLSAYEESELHAGRSTSEWRALGQHYVDCCLHRLGLTPRYAEVLDVRFPWVFGRSVRELVESLREGGLEYREFAEALFATRDPLFWFEAAPLLARLSIAKADSKTLDSLVAIAKEEFADAPWIDFLVRQATLQAESAFPGRQPAERVAFAGGEAEEGMAVLRGMKVPLPKGTVSSLAGLQRSLDPAGERSVILRVSVESLGEFLSLGAVVIAHEERSVHPGFARIWALDTSGERLLVDSMHVPGYEYRTWKEQEGLMALYGNAALVFWKDGKPEDVLCEHDPDLALVGGTESDTLEPDAGRARQEELAKQATQACNDVPRAWQLYGQALLAQLRADELEDDNADGPVERWYGQARTRFVRAEWAHQVYAQALEKWGQFEEAAIAWNDAFCLDGHDARNLLGIARTRAREGLTSAAVWAARGALTADPSMLDAWRLRAELAASAGDDDLARLAAAIVLQVEPEDASAHQILGRCAETKEELAEALGHYDRAATSGDASHLARASIVAARMGDAEGALQRALAVVDNSPEEFVNHLRGSHCFVAMGQGEDALGILEFALSRFGPHEALVGGYVQRITDLLTEKECEERVIAFLDSWSEYERPLVDFGVSLSSAGHSDLALRCFDAADLVQADSLNPRWQKVQCHMQANQGQKAAELLEGVLEETTMPHAFALWIELRASRDADACWERLGKADASHNPALVWASARYLAGLRGDEESANGLSERLLGIGVGALESAMHFLLHNRALVLAGSLLPMLEAHPDAASNRENRLLLQALFASREGEELAASELLHTMHKDFSDATVTWQEMAIVLRAGSSEALTLLAEKALRGVLRGAPESFGDSCMERGYLASAVAMDGDFAALESLISAYPKNNAILASAVRVAHQRSDVHTSRWQEMLGEVAPGLNSRIQEELSKGAKA